MAVANGGELIILCPGINTFGEDPENDLIIQEIWISKYRKTA